MCVGDCSGFFSASLDAGARGDLSFQILVMAAAGLQGLKVWSKRASGS